MTLAHATRLPSRGPFDQLLRYDIYIDCEMSQENKYIWHEKGSGSCAPFDRK